MGRGGSSRFNPAVTGGIFIRGLWGDVTCEELETGFERYCKVLCAARHPRDAQVCVCAVYDV